MPRPEQPFDLPHGVQGPVPGGRRVCSGSRSASKIGSKTSTHRHLHHAIPDGRIPSGRCLPSGLGCTRVAPVAVDTSSPSALPPVRPATGPRRTPRCPRTSGRRPPVPRRWYGSGRRRTPGCLDDTPCRTAGRTDSRAIPSLWHATPPGVSEPSLEVIGSRQSPGSRALSDVGLELRPLPSTGVTRLRRYYGPVRHPGRPGLSLAGVRLRVTRSHRWGFPCCVGSPCAACRRHYPGGTPGSCRFMRREPLFPSGCGLPRT